MSFLEKLRRAARERRTQLCVGLDPDPERIAGGAAGALRHCTEVVRQTSDVTCCYKPNAAFWEQYGPAGLEALLELRRGIPHEIPVLYDAKRADVAGTMAAYAGAIFGALEMDAVTAHAYQGVDSLEELAGDPERAVYVVCRSSNPGARDLQEQLVAGTPLFLLVAALAGRVNGHGNVGLVVGATAPAQVAEVRALSALPFLIPGIGAQDGDLEGSVRAAWNGDEASCLVSASRSVIYAEHPGAAARSLQSAINAVLAGL